MFLLSFSLHLCGPTFYMDIGRDISRYCCSNSPIFTKKYWTTIILRGCLVCGMRSSIKKRNCSIGPQARLSKTWRPWRRDGMCMWCKYSTSEELIKWWSREETYWIWDMTVSYGKMVKIKARHGYKRPCARVKGMLEARIRWTVEALKCE